MYTRASLRFYAATNVMVVLGVAVAVAVLAGALLVGASVRESLRQMALARLGAVDAVITAPTFFRRELAADVVARGHASAGAFAIRSAAPLIVLNGAVVHEDSKRVAGNVMVYGIDDSFGAFHGLNGVSVSGRNALISEGLAAELGAGADDSVTLRVARPTDIPLSTLQGRRDVTGERIRATVTRVLDSDRLGEFSLAPSQGPVLALYLPMTLLQRELAIGDRVNTVLLARRAQGTQGADALLEDFVSPVTTLDDLGLSIRETTSAITQIETRAGLIARDLEKQIEQIAAQDKREVVPALTYVANTIRVGDREIPYSTVVAIDRIGGTDLFLPPPSKEDPVQPILLNQWAIDDLKARTGDRVTLEYYLWSDHDGLQTAQETFVLRGAVPMEGAGGDPTLTPHYPGITDATDMTSWDPPFPVDLKRIRLQDENYWDRWRAAPKAIVPLMEGQRLWGSRYGRVSSLRLAGGTTVSPQAIDPVAAGFSARLVRADALAAAEGTTDFGQYFLYFSFFLVVSALLLAYLFFAVGLEQRTREVGLLAAVGYSPAAIRRAFVIEGVVLATAGAIVGALGAVGFASIIMYGLRTWWVGAVGTTRLQLHVAPEWIAIGVAGALAAGLLALWAGVRAMSRRSPRDLLSGAPKEAAVSFSRDRARTMPGIVFGLLGIALLVAASIGSIEPVAGFFGAGGAWLIAGLLLASHWLRRGRSSQPFGRGITGVLQLGLRSTAVRPARSVLSLALIAFACFVLVSVGAFRKEGGEASGDKRSGTGGFTLIAESVAPLMHDPNTADGRDGLGLDGDDPVLSNARITRFRLKPGDESSCLTLYKPTDPRIIAPEQRFITDNRFSFASSLAESDAERANPWTLLDRQFDDGAVPAIADQTTLMYVLHLGVGDDFELAQDGRPPVRLRIVAALSDSMLQSELIIGEAAFVYLFPRQEGYRVWMIEADRAAATQITTHLEERLADFGLDAIDTQERWASYHQVENTYLATFQALGSLGLLLGTVGLAAVLARNVLERKREIGLLNAVGFRPGDVRSMVLSEGVALVGGGLLLGAGCAIVAVLPALRERAQAVPLDSLAGLLLAVMATGVVSSLVAVHIAARGSLIQAIKSE